MARLKMAAKNERKLNVIAYDRFIMIDTECFKTRCNMQFGIV